MEDNRLQRRVVGAVVLVALAVIFVPMLLTGPDEGGGWPDGNLTEPPDGHDSFKVIDLRDLPGPPPEPPAAPVVRDSAPSGADAGAARPPAPAPSPVKHPAPAPAAAQPAAAEPTEGWVVQVGSFSQRDNAQALERRLSDGGYPVFVEAIAGAKGTTYRVRVGPKARREEAEALQARLRTELETEPMVMAHP